MLADLRQDLLAVRQQGRRQCCLAFATSTAHEHRGRHSEALSVEYLYFHAVGRTVGADPGAGTTMAAVAAALHEEGQPLETAWAYETVQRYAPDWSPPAELGSIYRATMEVGISSVDEICDALDARQAVILGLVITDAFLFPDSTGVVPALMPDPERGGHAVLAVGHGCASGGDRLVFIRNSWGERWGLGGYAWLSEAYLAQQLHQTAILA